MQTRTPVAVLSLIAMIAGCAAQREPAPSSSYPASPMAAETPSPNPSTTLKTTEVRSERAAAPGENAPADANVTAAPVAYTCPHHPRVMEAEAGECPSCGMSLEPTTSVQTSPLRQRDDNPTIAPSEGTEGAEEQKDDAGAHEHGGHE